MDQHSDYKPLLNLENHKCFGCSPTNPSPGEGSFFYAGWNTWRHGSRDSGTIDATHLENYYVFMQAANREQYVHDLAESMLLFMETHYGLSLGVNDITPSLPIKSRLQQNHPNPFNPITLINYSLSGESDISLIIYNLHGQEINTLVNTLQAAGNYRAYWDGHDERGQPISSGVYLCRLQSGTLSETIKMVYLR